MEKQKMLALIETYDTIPFVDEWNGKKIPGELEVKKYPKPIDMELMVKFHFPVKYDKSPLYTFILFSQRNVSINDKTIGIEKFLEFYKNPEKELQLFNTQLSHHPENTIQNQYKLCIGEIKHKNYTALIFYKHISDKVNTPNFEYAFLFNDGKRYYFAGLTELQMNEELKQFEVETIYKFIYEDQVFYQFFHK
jgi:hypothetical protein